MRHTAPTQVANAISRLDIQIDFPYPFFEAQAYAALLLVAIPLYYSSALAKMDPNLRQQDRSLGRYVQIILLLALFCSSLFKVAIADGRKTSAIQWAS